MSIPRNKLVSDELRVSLENPAVGRYTPKFVVLDSEKFNPAGVSSGKPGTASSQQGSIQASLRNSYNGEGRLVAVSPAFLAPPRKDLPCQPLMPSPPQRNRYSTPSYNQRGNNSKLQGSININEDNEQKIEANRNDSSRGVRSRPGTEIRINIGSDEINDPDKTKKRNRNDKMSQSLNISKITKKDFQPLQSLTSIGGISKQIAVAAQEAGDVSLQKENIDSNLKDQTFSGQQFTTTGSGGGKFAQHRPDSTFQFASKVAARSEIATPSDCAQDYYVSHDTTNKLCEKMSTKQRTTVYSQPKASDDIYGSNAIKVSQRYALGSIDKFYEVHLDVVQNRSPQLVDMKRTTTRANNRGGLRTGSQGGGRSGGTRPKISSGYLDEDDGNDLYGVVENDALYNVRDDILSKRPSSKSATLSHSLQTPHPSMRIQPHFSATNTRTEAEINYEKADKPVRFRTDKTMPFGKSDQPLMLVTHSNNYGRQNKIDPYTGKQYHPTDTADSRGNALPIELYDVKIDVTRRRFPQQIPFGFDQREKLYRPKTLTADLDYCPDVTSGIWLQQKLDAAEKKELDQERQYAINSLQQSNIPQEQVGNESGIGASQASGELLHNQQQKNVRQRSRSADAFLSDTINMQKKQDIKKNGILAKVAPSLIDEYDKLRENLEWRSSQKGSSTLLNSSKLPLSLTTTSLYVPDKDDFTLVSAGVRQHNSIIPFTSYPTRAQVDVERFNDKQLDKFYESGKGDDVVRRKNVINVDISNVISRKSNVISHFTSIPPLNDLMYDPIKGEKVVSRHIRAADLRNGAGGGRRQTGEGSITGYMKANDTVPFYDMQQAVSYIKPRILGTKIAPKINS